MIIEHFMKFSLRSAKAGADADAERPVRLRVTYAGTRTDVSTSVSLRPSDWDPALQVMKKGAVNRHGQSATEVNAILNGYRSRIDHLMSEHGLKGTLPSPDELKATATGTAATGILKPEDRAESAKTAPADNISEAFERYMEENTSTKAWTMGTCKVFNTLWKDLHTFDRKLTFASIDEAFLAGYTKWLRYDKPKDRSHSGRTFGGHAGDGLMDTTVKKHVSSLKSFLRWADGHGYPVNPAYMRFHPKFKTPDGGIVFLTQKEVRALAALDLSGKKDTLRYVRDTFLFCCYSGLRYSDAANLRKCDVGESAIDVTTVKTSDALHIDLNAVTREILKRYSEDESLGDRALPVISNQKTNVMIKELCRMAGIDAPVRRTRFRAGERIDDVRPKYEVVASHTARRTFICNGFSKGIPFHVMMKWTGHSSYDTMKTYIDAADETKRREMDKYDDDGIRLI